MKLMKMFTQRAVVGCVRNMFTYSKYRIYREEVIGLYGLSTVKIQTNSSNQFHTSSVVAYRVSGTSKKIPGMMDREVIRVHKSMSVGEFAEALNTNKEYVIKRVLNAKITEEGEDINEHTMINNELFLRKEVLLLGYRVEVAARKKQQEKTVKKENLVKNYSESLLVKRPPVVTIMGHVDHGKTTLLDTLRKSNIVAKEFGGITQHIGAFLVSLPSGETITFLDTPGHAAFSAMRARGAKLTDIIILVVAADDGVLPQTVESIEHAKNSNVPIIVAVNKIDRPGYDYEKVKLMLLEHGVIPEDAGGNVQVVPISALKGTNIDALQEAVIVQAELMELKGDPTGDVEGRVVESETHAFLGKTATVIVQKGTLKQGDFIVAGNAYAKVRKMLNEHGQEVNDAGLSTPVRVTGWKELPSAGEEILQVKNERLAKNYTSLKEKEIRDKKANVSNPYWEEVNRKLRDYYIAERKKQQLYKRAYYRPTQHAHSNVLGSQTLKLRDGPELFVQLLCDVDGSLEAIMDVLDTYSSKMCKLTILDSKVGNINKKDVDLAVLSNAIIYGFNISPSQEILQYAQDKNVRIKLHNVIYALFDCLRNEINSQLPIATEETLRGEATVLKTFPLRHNKKSVLGIGCSCTSGALLQKEQFKLLRGDEVIYQGEALSLKKGKEKVSSVDEGTECGLILGPNAKPQEGDKIICYSQSKNTPQVDWNPGFS